MKYFPKKFTYHTIFPFLFFFLITELSRLLTGPTSGGYDTFLLGAHGIACKPRVSSKSGELDWFKGYKTPFSRKYPLTCAFWESNLGGL